LRGRVVAAVGRVQRFFFLELFEPERERDREGADLVLEGLGRLTLLFGAGRLGPCRSALVLRCRGWVPEGLVVLVRALR
jgi:hypothetical protein